jgi:hypothetical protein
MPSHLRIVRDGDIAVVSLRPTMRPALFTELGQTFTTAASEGASALAARRPAVGKGR